MAASEQSSKYDGERVQLLAQKANAEIQDFILDPVWTMDKMRRLAPFFPHPKLFQAYMDMIYLQLEGKNPKCPGDFDINATKFRDQIADTIYRAWNETLTTTSLDPLSRMGAMEVYPQTSVHGYDFKEFSPYFYTRPLEGAGHFGQIVGPLGQALGVGKTDFALTEAEMLLTQGHCVGTNILIKDDIKNVFEVMTLKDLMTVSIKNLLKGKFTKFFLDGSPQFMERERATSGKNVNIKKVQYLLRKVGADMIVIAQRSGEVTTSIAEMSTFRVTKVNKERMWFERDNQRFLINNVPGTSIRFETGDFETFETDFDIDGLHTMISQMPKEERMGTGQLQAILTFLERSAYTITEQDKKTACKVLLLNRRVGISQQEIAELIGVSNGTITNWKKSMGLEIGVII